MSEEIKVGDVVYLKSDRNMKMTVAEFRLMDGMSFAACLWFVGGELKGGNFPLTSLRRVKNDQ